MSARVQSSHLTREGWTTIPAAARRALGVAAGDRLQFVVEGDQVTFVSARQMLTKVWASNHGGDDGDAMEDVRALRHADAQADADALARIDAAVGDGDGPSTEEVTAGLLAALGFSRYRAPPWTFLRRGRPDVRQGAARAARQHATVTVLDASRLVRWLERLPVALSDAEVAEVAALAAIPGTWQRRPDPSGADPTPAFERLQVEVASARRARVLVTLGACAASAGGLSTVMVRLLG